MKVEFKNLNEKIISYQFGKSIIKITEKKDTIKNSDNYIYSKLQSMDAVVRNHEQAHLQALGPYASSIPGYSFVTGPDGNYYFISSQPVHKVL